MSDFCLLENRETIKRYIGKAEGEQPGDCTIFFGGVHGNEPAGFVALQHFFKIFEEHKLESKIRGSIFGLSGNIQGLKENTRYVDADLNRIWTPQILRDTNKKKQESLETEFAQQKELLDIIDHLVNTRNCYYHFVDLHTTSGPTIPFVTINDTVANRKLAGYLPIPTVLGIEEYLEGTIMDFINDLGFPAIGIEAGQHCDERSVELHLASIWISLVAIKTIAQKDVPNFEFHYNLLQEAAGFEFDQVYEVTHREAITESDKFKMQPDYLNFQSIEQNELLAHSSKGKVMAPTSGKIFMPLYQNQGGEGFFVIQKINKFWLNLSIKIRSGRFESFLTSLPGIKKDPERTNVLVVNKGIAKFFSQDFMHLLGYRRVQRNGNIVCFTKREVPVGNWPYYLKD